jgi:hypothetical protein
MLDKERGAVVKATVILAKEYKAAFEFVNRTSELC